MNPLVIFLAGFVCGGVAIGAVVFNNMRKQLKEWAASHLEEQAQDLRK